MANGIAAAVALLSPAPEHLSTSISAEAAVDKPGAAPAGMELEHAVGMAVADATVALYRAMESYGHLGEIDPETHNNGGCKLAKVAELWLDRGLADADFIALAREHGKLQLRRLGISQSTDVAIDAVIEITSRVVKDERSLRARWAN